jgi:hypothetical protein
MILVLRLRGSCLAEAKVQQAGEHSCLRLLGPSRCALRHVISRLSKHQLTQYQVRSRALRVSLRFEPQNAIISRGLTVDFNGQVSKMLERTGADVGSTRPIYKQGEYFIFCSAKLSRATMEADPVNLGFCPYIVFIMYETATAPGTVKIGYRRPQLLGSVKSRTALREVERLLDGVVRDAIM